VLMELGVDPHAKMEPPTYPLSQLGQDEGSAMSAFELTTSKMKGVHPPGQLEIAALISELDASKAVYAQVKGLTNTARDEPAHVSRARAVAAATSSDGTPQPSHHSTPNLRTSIPLAYNHHVPYLTQRTHATGLWVARNAAWRPFSAKDPLKIRHFSTRRSALYATCSPAHLTVAPSRYVREPAAAWHRRARRRPPAGCRR
jgi:hypothetical protein